jgi:hypothetical protein
MIKALPEERSHVNGILGSVNGDQHLLPYENALPLISGATNAAGTLRILLAPSGATVQSIF